MPSLESRARFFAAVSQTPIYYTSNLAESERLVQRHILDEPGVRALGFDTEWRPTFYAGQHNPIALVQLYTGKCCLLLHVVHFGSFPSLGPRLRHVLEDRNLLKIGFNLNQDVKGMGMCASLGERV